MPGPAGSHRDARALLRRVESGDREAAYDLARILRPDTISELICFVCTPAAPRPELFDVLADAYQAYQDGR